MKTIPPITKLLVTLADLLPTGEELRIAAYESMAGDEATSPEGRHGGSDPDRLDMTGLSKRMVYQRALAHDLAWFDAQAAAVRADPYTWAPSLRKEVPKGHGKGTRPIDDPPEIKRLVALVVRSKLKEKFIARFTRGQMGSHPGTCCTRKGATAQDHVATAIMKSIWARYTWCVLIDLEDAFGRIPEILALREFGSMGLDAEAAKFLWHLVRIHAVACTTRDLAVLKTREDMGIEQGNPLSAFVMDLVLAPVMGQIGAQHDVRAYSYLDDIYLMCLSKQEAQDAYKGFRAIAEGLAFDNVRGLWVPGGREAQGKNSLIVDATVTTIRVLRLYDINLQGISAAPEAETAYRQKLKKDGKKFSRMTLNQARNALNCQALTAKATRARNHLMFMCPPTGCHHSPSVPKCPSSPSGRCTRVAYLGAPAPKEQVTDEVQQPFSTEQKDVAHENPADVDLMSPRAEVAANGLFPQSQHVEGDQEGCKDPIDVPVDDDNLVEPLEGDQGVGAPCQPEDDAEATLPSGVGDQGDDDPEPDVLLRPLGVGCGVPHGDGLPPHLLGDESPAGSSRQNQDGSVHLLREGDSTRSWGPHQPCVVDRADDGDRPVPHYLSLEDPAVQGALAAGHGFKMGATHKGAVLDLTGLEDLGLDDRVLLDVVNGLVKAVRTEHQATVIIDPAESWTATPTLLGMVDDKTYERRAVENLPDGKMQVTLLHKHKVSRPTPTKKQLAPPPLGVDAVLAVMSKNRAAGTYELRVIEDGVLLVREVVVHVASPIGGVVAAVASWAAARTGKVVAVPARGHLAAVVTMLDAGKCRSPNIDFGDAVRALLAARVWTLVEGWACGRCCTGPRPAGPASPRGTGGR